MSNKDPRRAFVGYPIVIRDFQPADQDEARNLILNGLHEHWGDAFDPSQNPDLDDIATSYQGGRFLVARAKGRLVGTGAFLPEREGVARILRMSVAADLRHRGIGGQLLKALCKEAKKRGFPKIVLETTSTWHGAIAFYRDFGFDVVNVSGEDTHFVLERGELL